MQEKSDARLLRDYAERRDEAAFRKIVMRYTDFVYSAAKRDFSHCGLGGGWGAFKPLPSVPILNQSCRRGIFAELSLAKSQAP
jgi:hypothetical protein